MRRNLFFSLFLIFGLGLGLSSCTPGLYAGASVGAPYPYYGPRYYGPRYYGSNYYAPRPVIIAPVRPYYGGGYHGDHGWHGGGRASFNGGGRGNFGGGGFGGGRGNFGGGGRRGR